MLASKVDLVLEGGGVKGIGLVGMVLTLREWVVGLVPPSPRDSPAQKAS